MNNIYQKLAEELGITSEEVSEKFQKIRDAEALYLHAIGKLYGTDELILGYVVLLPYSEALRKQKKHGSLTTATTIDSVKRKELLKDFIELAQQHYHST